MNNFFLTALFAAIFLTSCEPDEKDIDKYNPKGSFDSGVLVLNEGSFNGGNASVSFLSFDLNTTQNNIFSNANNGAALGDTAQSIAFNGELAYIIVNNSNKVEVVNRYTMIKTGAITTGLDFPRYMTFANGKGYVTNWADPSAATPRPSFLAVINLATNTVESKITCVNFPEKIIENSSKLYVAHDNYATGNSISVINASTNTIEGTPIDVVYGPNSLEIVDGFLWVCCSGKGSFPVASNESAGSLQKINLATKTVENTYFFPAVTDHPSNLAIVNSKAYYTVNSKVYKMSLIQLAPATTLSLPTTPAFTSSIPNLYGFAIKNNRIYISGFETFSGNGTALIYSLGDVQDSPAIGTLLRTTGVGVGPNGFYFNQ